ncbi:MAG: ATP-binding protein [Bacillota bacterium]|jgi:hypothetical protein|nr:ATP-binding protein [Bacillota bacterium]MDD3297706.1 ATP-binding protein [Bacillota bacterium]MDD3850399.1 ATP-binding protein [Bacillota bacterium]MDD4706594.1 ATP-binding protein [Bacillota bacterium]
MQQDKRIRIITGHYGSGKTEFSVNYVIRLAKSGKKAAIADLDIVNPYFRSREEKGRMERIGIRVVAPEGKFINADVPALPADIYTLLQDESYQAVLDVGGDAAGARALGRYYDHLKDVDYDMFIVINANRPNTGSPQAAIEYIEEIERAARIRATGLINNTHMLRDTTLEDVLRGQRVVEEVSRQKNMPVKYICAIERIAGQIPEGLTGEVFPVKMYMRPDWL